jgi:hypothetical protein
MAHGCFASVAPAAGPFATKIEKKGLKCLGKQHIVREPRLGGIASDRHKTTSAVMHH